VVHSEGDAGAESRLEYPLGTMLHRTTGSIRFVRVSPDGDRIAFLEDRDGRAVGGHVAMVDMKGTVTKLTDEWPSVRGLAWSPSGDEIWFTAGDARTKRALHAVTLEGKQRVVLAAPGSMTLWDIARDGRVLLTRDEERRAVIGVPPGETTERDFSWFDEAGLADLSADGRWLLIGDRFGIYLRPTDGSDPIPLGLTDAFADDLSPDGNTVLATKSGRLVLVPKGAGDPRPLPAHGITRYAGARWFPDGLHILFNGTQGDRPMRSYVQDLKGGPPTPLTPEGTRAISISVSGEWVATFTQGKRISLYPVRGGEPRVVAGSELDERPIGWSADDRSLWVYRRGEVPASVFQVDVVTGRRQLWKTVSPADPVGVIAVVDLQITPSGSAYFYSYTQLLSQLYIVRGLK
jgi:eukaryotic-like serine/threonine-protein kinase